MSLKFLCRWHVAEHSITVVHLLVFNSTSKSMTQLHTPFHAERPQWPLRKMRKCRSIWQNQLHSKANQSGWGWKWISWDPSPQLSHPKTWSKLENKAGLTQHRSRRPRLWTRGFKCQWSWMTNLRSQWPFNVKSKFSQWRPWHLNWQWLEVSVELSLTAWCVSLGLQKTPGGLSHWHATSMFWTFENTVNFNNVNVIHMFVNDTIFPHWTPQSSALVDWNC